MAQAPKKTDVTSAELTPPATAIDTELGKVWLGQDRVVRIVIDDVPAMRFAATQQLLGAVKTLTGGQRRPILADMRRSTVSPDREVRRYYSNEAMLQHTVAVALLVGSPVTRMIANYFLMFHKPAYPARLFTDATDAIAWLREFVT